MQKEHINFLPIWLRKFKKAFTAKSGKGLINFN